MRDRGDILVPISPGELLDKITILEIKTERLSDPSKVKNVTYELSALRRVQEAHLDASEELGTLVVELKEINETLWEIEDDIRDCERDQSFGEKFIALARAVYQTNDRRSAVKRQINEHLGSKMIEEKSYAPY